MSAIQSVSIRPEEHLGLVGAIAQRYANRGRAAGMDGADLVQAGAIGLLKAAATYDPDKGIRFSSYAWKAVACTIRRALGKQWTARQLSTLAVAGEDMDIEPEAPAVEFGAGLDIQALLGRLPTRERELVRLRYGLGGEREWSTEELAGRYGISASRIKALLGRALERLRRQAGVVRGAGAASAGDDS